jgi:hypothetical protein
MSEKITLEVINPETWQKLISACHKCKWLVLLERLMEQQNQPQDLGTLDIMLKEKLPDITSIMYPTSSAITSLNGYLTRALIPYRIKQVTYGENCYKGTVQVKYHVSHRQGGKCPRPECEGITHGTLGHAKQYGSWVCTTCGHFIN